MKNMLRWLLSTPVLGTLAVLAVSALVWWLGPLLAFGSAADVSRPLGPQTVRAVLLALLWLGWGGWLGWRAWRRRRLHASLLQGIAAPASASDAEAQVLAGKFRAAVAQLKTRESGAARWLGGEAALYALPWYVFIGAPGSGKTTALLQAGLDFVLTDGQAPVKGVGGTRHCDWWFTREAVLIDTAGRYALQESDAATDAAAWQRFLALLAKSRPRQPINGVLLTVSVQDLLQGDAAERQAHADKLRARLHELRTALGIDPPVYLLVTKTDLVAGFAETFDALGKDGREQVWGVTLPLASTGAATGTETAATDPLAALPAQLLALQQRLAAGLFERLQAESDPARRAAMFSFPQEFAALRGTLDDFVRQVAAPLPQQAALRLRGLYFTSGTQEGTPIDRAMGALSRAFGLERRLAPVAGGQGKSFFLRRLLQEVVFTESHLVARNARAERRRLLLRTAGFASVAVVSAAVAAGWAISHSRNRAYVTEVEARLPAVRQTLAALPPATSADVAPLAAPLAAVRDAARPAGFAPDAPPLLDGLGLYQGELLGAGAQRGHARVLQHALLPRITERLAERLRAANKDNLEQAYEALKAYLMLYTPEQFDAEALKAWIAIDWDSQLRNLPPEQRAELDRQLAALLALGAPASATPQDVALVTSVRDMLASYPLEYRIYSRLKRQFRGSVAEFSVAAKAGPQAPAVFVRASGEPLSRGVPGLYTREGHAKAFQGSLGATAAQLAREEQWVLGRQGGGTGGAAGAVASAALGSALPQRVKRLYLEDYIKTWDAFLADVRLVKLGGTAQSLEVARLLAGVDSPLAAFLRAAAAETTLMPPPAAPAGALGQAAQAAQAAADKAKGDLARMVDPGAAPAAATDGPIEKMVDDHFAALHRLVAGQPSPLDEMGKAMAELHAHLQAVDAAAKSKQPPPAGGGGAKAKAAAAQLPEPARSMVTALADAGERQGRDAEREVMTGDLKPIYDLCTRAIANRYPFAPASRADVLPEDFGQLFGAGGLLDEFFQRRLAALVDTSGATWTYKPLVDGTRPAAPAALADFQRAARIREAFFRSGGKQPGFRLDIKAADLGGLAELVLDIDGQVSKLTAGGPPVTVSWPSQRVASQIKLAAGGTAAPAGQPIVTDGPWALFRLFDRFEVQPSAQPEKFSVLLTLDGKRVRLDITASSVLNPFRLREMQQFRCPGAL